MLNKERIIKNINKSEDRVLVSKLLDKAVKSENSVNIVYSDFLDPYQKRVADMAFAADKEINYTYNGGYPGAEREIVVFCPKNMSVDDFRCFKLPFKVIELRTKEMENLSHRDFLGALMGLGIKREKIGDILLEEDICRVVVINEIADFIKFNLLKVGSSKVDMEIKDIDEIRGIEPKLKEISITVASMRLDCIASAGFGISRNKIAEYIKAEKVNINWEKTVSLTKQIQEGDTISIRGKGRIILERTGSITRKGRINILLKKFI